MIAVPALLVRLAAGIGIPEPFRRIAGVFIGLVGILALCGASILAFNLWLARHDRHVITAYEYSVRLDLIDKARKADAQSAKTIRDGEGSLAAKRKEMNDVLSGQSDEGLSDLDVVLLCRELRDAGTDTGAFPRCRYTGAGAKTHP